MKKNILITGGTSGIGFNAAKTLVKNQDNNLILIKIPLIIWDKKKPPLLEGVLN